MKVETLSFKIDWHIKPTDNSGHFLAFVFCFFFFFFSFSELKIVRSDVSRAEIEVYNCENETLFVS